MQGFRGTHHTVIGDLADPDLGVRHVAVRARSTGGSGVNKVKNQDGNALMILSGKRLSGIRKDLPGNSISSIQPEPIIFVEEAGNARLLHDALFCLIDRGDITSGPEYRTGP